MILTTQNFCGVGFLALFVCAAQAEADTPSHRGYHLFKPVPANKLRPLSADRPDATESTQTVDAGHVQIEADIASYLRDRAGAYETSYAFAVTNLKFGITHNFDLQFVFAPYVKTKTRSGGVTTTKDGISNLTIRAKVNLWGNDGDTKTSLALLPLITIPTGGTSVEGDNLEGGLVIPFATELPGGWGLGLQVGVDVVRKAADNGHVADYSQTIVLGHDIVGPLAGFVEFFSVFPGDAGADWFGTVNAGLTYGVNDNVQLDVAVFVGVNRVAPDVLVFSGITWRF